MLKAKSPDMVRAAAGFHRHETGSQALQKVQQVVSLKSLTKHNHPRRIQPRKAADGLAQINPQNVDIHQNAPLSTYDRNNSRGLVGRQFIPLAQIYRQTPKG